MYTNHKTNTTSSFSSILKRQEPINLDVFDYEQETTEIEFSKIQAILAKDIK